MKRNLYWKHAIPQRLRRRPGATRARALLARVRIDALQRSGALVTYAD